MTPLKTSYRNPFLKRKQQETFDAQKKNELQRLTEKFEKGTATPEEIERLSELADLEINKNRR
jgi:hypothetical protein